MLKKLLLFLFVVACTVTGVAQMGTGISQFATAVTGDNFALCSVSTGRNCFNLSGPASPVTFTKVGAGVDKFALALDVNGNIYKFNEYPSGIWTALPNLGTGYKGIAVGDANHVYVLKNARGADFYIYQLNMSTGALTAVAGGAGQQISAKGSTVTTAISNGDAFVSQNGGEWTLLPCVGCWRYVSPASIGYSDFVGAKTDESLWYYNGSTLKQITPGGGLAIEMSLEGDIYVIGGDNPDHIYHLILYNFLSGKIAWDELGGGPMSAIATGGTMFNWFIGPPVNGYTIYRFADQAIGGQTTLTENSVQCSGPGCPATHVGKTSAGLNLSSSNTPSPNTVPGSLTQWTGNPTNPFNIKSIAWDSNPFDCLDDFGCNMIFDNSTVNCSVLGNIDNQTLADGGPLPLCPPDNQCCSLADPGNKSLHQCSAFCPQYCPPPPPKPPVPPTPPKPKPTPLPLPYPCKIHCRK
jgi:hypothetical protein